ncbi:MAG: pirin family protein [Deltaproteobacteria bacterium]|nr:pirin family protein [Deltaproteobacteria bacterium]
MTTRRDVLVQGLSAMGGVVLARCTPAPSAGVLGATRRAQRIPPNAAPEVLAARATEDGAGARLRRLFPHRAGEHRDPFVLLDDFAVGPPAGFPTHPHRGFEAFTYMLDGAFEHQDSLGNHSTVHTGGVQIFTSGSGAFHSEMPGRAQVNRGLQLWVNLPRARKRMAPRYRAHHGHELPEHSVGLVRVRTVVGPQSPVHLETAMSYLDLSFSEQTASFESEIATGHQGLVYVADGSVRLGDVSLLAGQYALVREGELRLLGERGSRAVLIAGRPHEEPIDQHGPYVD